MKYIESKYKIIKTSMLKESMNIDNKNKQHTILKREKEKPKLVVIFVTFYG